jgi:hypothetical protein
MFLYRVTSKVILILFQEDAAMNGILRGQETNLNSVKNRITVYEDHKKDGNMH